MSRNTVHKVATKDTTESSKKRKAAIDEAKRKADIPKLERRNPRTIGENFTAPMFDINQMALDAKGKAPRDALREFYGDKTDEIVNRAIELRAKYNGLKPGDIDPNTLSPMNVVLRIQNEPQDRARFVAKHLDQYNRNELAEIPDRRALGGGVTGFISWLMNRAYATSKGAHTEHDKSAAGHERLGHNLNPAADFAGNVNGRDEFANDNELLLSSLYALIGDGNAFYTHRNQNEFAAAFGNLRKSIYKRSEGRLDIADPDTFREVSYDAYKNPDTYKGPWLTDDSRELLKTGSLYPGFLVPADRGTIERGYEIDSSMQNPEYTHQFVKNDETDKSARAAEKGGESSHGGKDIPMQPQGSSEAAQTGGPRIVINPSVFRDKRDALCVAMNEAYRILMEMNGFEPQAEPTPAQRRFFADTAYANDELQLRRTILARICTFDTSIS